MELTFKKMSQTQADLGGAGAWTGAAYPCAAKEGGEGG